jgi:tetratricopeptide (TPR) repeat protein
VHGPAHLLLARGFFRSSPAQARLEYRYAMAQAPERVWEIQREVAPLVNDFDDAMELVAPGTLGDIVIASLVGDLAKRLPATRERLAQELLRRRPDDVELLTRRSEESLGDLAMMESWCIEDAGRACTEQGLLRARRLQEVAPQLCAGFGAEAILLARSGEAERAFQTLSVALDHVDDRSACLVRLIEVAKLTGSELRTTNAIDSLARAGCATEDACVANLVQAAAFDEQRGNSRRALAFTRKALERAPERDDLVASAARSASRLGLHSEALDGYARLSRRHPEDPTWSVLADGERQALVR